MIILDMLRLKMVVVEDEDLVTLIFRVTFLIFLKIFLEKVLVVVEEKAVDLIIEDLI